MEDESLEIAVWNGNGRDMAMRVSYSSSPKASFGLTFPDGRESRSASRRATLSLSLPMTCHAWRLLPRARHHPTRHDQDEAADGMLDRGVVLAICTDHPIAKRLVPENNKPEALEESEGIGGESSPGDEPLQLDKAKNEAYICQAKLLALDEQEQRKVSRAWDFPSMCVHGRRLKGCLL